MKNPLVSVLMTAFNREKYIAQAIESVLLSTYTNFEFIIVDDCSKDKTVEIAQSFAAKDRRVRVYVNEQNLGDYHNRNQAASYAKGKYLKYVDADDMIYPHGLEVLVSMMEKFPDAGYGLCTMDKDHQRIYPYALSPHEAYKQHYFARPIFIRAPLSSIIVNQSFKEIGGFSGQRYSGDFEFWLRMSQKYPVVLMPQGIVWYRRHSEQEFSNHKDNPSISFSYYNVTEKYLNDLKCPLNSDESAKALKLTKHLKTRYVFRILRKGDFRNVLKLHSISNMNIFSYIKHFFI